MMKKIIFSFVVLIVFTNCNSQSLNNQFISDLNSENVINVSSYKNEIFNKIEVKYPQNINLKLQNVIDGYVSQDLKNGTCEGVDAKTQIFYEVKFYNGNTVSIFKKTDHVFCDLRDLTFFEVINLYVQNDIVYKLNFNPTNLELNNKINNFISTSDLDCNYSLKDGFKELIIEDKEVNIFFWMDEVCYSILNIADFQNDMFSLEQVD